MSDTAISTGPELFRSSLTTPSTTAATWTRPDGRRTLQLVLATVWLLDGVLQMQPVFFAKTFGTEMIAGTAIGNPSVIAHPITWAGNLIGHHPVTTNALFVLIQVALALGIAWRPTVKAALAASILWSLGVWWIGEGLGGVLTGGANPVNGAPGGVILYALLAVLLWPGDRSAPPSPFVAARAIGAPRAKALWLVLWSSLAYFALLGANRSPQGLHALIIGQNDGEPGWVAWINRNSASLVAHRGLASMIVVAVLLVVVAIGVYLPTKVANATLVLATVISLWFWVVGQDFGDVFTNGATDVNTGPLLVLLAAAYWQHRSAGPAHNERTVDHILEGA